MKKFILGMVLFSGLASAAVVEVDGNSTTLRSGFGSTKYDLSLDAQVSFADEFKLAWSSDLISTGEQQDLKNGGLNSLAEIAKTEGVKHVEYLDLIALQGAPDAASVCSLASNAAIFSAAHVICEAGTSADDIKISAPIHVDYSIKGSIQLDVYAMSEASAAAVEPLNSLKLGADLLGASMAALSDASAMKSAGGDIGTPMFAGLAAVKEIPLSFEVPFKGASFKSQRANVIKMAVVAASL
jgi:hypothetical protein